MNTTHIEKTACALRNDMPQQMRVAAFKVAALVFNQAGRADDPLASAFRKMASEDPGPAANRIATAVHSALGKNTLQGYEKVATAYALGKTLASTFRNLVPGVSSGAADVAKLLMVGSAGAGALGGAGIFAAKRKLESEDDKLLKLEQERNMMRALSKDIERELKLRKLTPTADNTAAVVDYLT